jgi:hypothetical protein
MSQLPAWEQMSDLDKGAALLHLRKIEVEGREYARAEYPARYIDLPALTGLDDEAASDHAESLFDGWYDAERTLGIDQVDRLRAVARDAQPTRRQSEEGSRG